MPNRRTEIAKNISPGRSPSRNGGTTAPAPAGQGVFNQTQLTGQWNPKGETKGTKFAKGGLNAPPQPGAPAPTQPQPRGQAMPWDVAAANDEAGAVKRLNNTLTGLDAGWFRTQQDYGLDAGFNDPASNPYSRSALLQRSYDNAKRGSRYGAGLGLFSGSYVNAQNSNTHQFSLGRDELQRSYGAANADYISGRQQAQDRFAEELSQAAWNRVNAGLESEPEPMPASGGAGDGGGGGGGKKPRGGGGQAAAAFGKKPQNRQDEIKQNISGKKKAR